MTLEESLMGKDIPEEIRKNVVLLDLPYFSFEREEHEGQLIIHRDLARETEAIFRKLFELKFPIQQMVPVVSFNWDDDKSMSANNTSAFNYRVIAGTNRLSNHSYGRAIDINPVQNPYTQRGGAVVPPGAQYDPTKLGTITPEIASVFKSYGWEWGGDWMERKDWQHFEKPDMDA